jgi:hypothetical protein
VSPTGLGSALLGPGAFDFDERKGEMTLRLVEERARSEAGRRRSSWTSVYQPPGALGGGETWIRLDLQNIADAPASTSARSCREPEPTVSTCSG